MYELTQAPGPIMCVVGARPNYMKVAPLIRALRADAAAPRTMLVHTGQHYDVEMNDRMFADLKLRMPDVNLGVGSGTHAHQTAEIMRRFEPVVDAAPQSCVVVVGDVNSTLACSLVAVTKGIPIVHVESVSRIYARTHSVEILIWLAAQTRDTQAEQGRNPGRHRFRRHPGRYDGARSSVPDHAREYRAPDHGRAGNQRARRQEAHAHPALRRRDPRRGRQTRSHTRA